MKKIKQLWVLLLAVLLTITLLPAIPGLNNKAYADETVVTVGFSGADYGLITYAIAAKPVGATFTIKLVSDITDSVDFNKSQNITLDLNGKVLTGKTPVSLGGKRSSVIINNTGGTLKIIDSSTEGNVHYFQVDKAPGENNAWVRLNYTPGKIDYTFDSVNGLRKYGETESCTDIPARYKYIAVTGGCITGGSGNDNAGYYIGCGIYNKSSLFLNGGIIIGNYCPGGSNDFSLSRGGGVMNTSVFTMQGGAIVGNAGAFAGGLFNSGSFTMKGGYIAYNYSYNGGGVDNAVYPGTDVSDENKIFKMENGHIVGNVVNNSDAKGGGIVLREGWKFIMENGSITSNIASGSSSYGGGIYLKQENKNTKATISGGEISGNHANAGGGIYIGDIGGGHLKLANNAKITNNTNLSGDKYNNILLYPNQTVAVEEGFRGSAGIALATYPSSGEQKNITEAAKADYHNFFFSDNPDYGIKNTGTGDNQVVVLVKHNSHSWKYTLSKTVSDNDTITARCDWEGTCLRDTCLTIQAPVSLEPDGTEKPATFGTATSFLGGALPTIYYQKKNGDTYETATTDAPTGTGTYKAYFTAGTDTEKKVAYVEYTIAKSVTISDISATAISYGQQLSDSTVSGTAKSGAADVTGTWAFKNPTTKPAVSDSQTTEYDVIFTPDSTDYCSADGKVKLTVNKAKVTVPTAKTNLIYNKTEQTGVELPKDAVYTLSGNKGTNAKADYSATATLTDKNNYEWNLTVPTTDDQSITWAIAKKKITVTAEDKTMVEGEKLPELTAKVKGLLGDDTVSYKIKKIESPTAGIYCIHPYGAAEQGNYEVAYKDAVLTVSASKKSEVAADSETQKEIYKKYASDSKYADKQLNLLLVTGDEISKADEKLILKEAGTKKSKMMDVALYLIISEEGKETQTKDIGDENDTILRFSYKFDFKNKTDIQVLRVHNEKVDELTTTKNKDGEYIEVNKEAGTINVYAKKYSTYAVTYNEVVAPGTGDFGNRTFWICFIIGALSLTFIAGAVVLLMEHRIKR